MRRLLIFMLSPLFLFSQVQIGNDIDGATAGVNSGYSVSVSSDGSIVAIGSPTYDDIKPGEVRVFEKNGDNWIQIGETIHGDHNEDRFGNSVSLSGDGSILAIGGPYNDNGGTVGGEDSGHVRVFENIGGDWTQIGDDIEGQSGCCDEFGYPFGDRFGFFVSLSNDGTKLAIAGPKGFDTLHGQPLIGYSRIYENIGGVWTQIGEDISTGIKGISNLTLSGDGSVVAIASPGEFDSWSFAYAGIVKVYKNISGVWVQMGNTFPSSNDFYWNYIDGISLSNDGSKIAIKSSSVWGGENYIRVYESINDDWEQQGEGIETGNYNSKISLSDNGHIIAIGGPATQLYEYGSGNWTQLGIDINEENSGDDFGRSIELSGDGTTLIVGAPQNDGNGAASGHARVYDLSALLSSDEFIFTQFNLYPNPAQHQFEIQLNSSLQLQKVNIYSNLGQFIQTTKEKIINTSSLSTGLYIVEVITNQGKATKKLVIK